MRRRELIRPTYAALLKKLLGLIVLAVLAYAGYTHYMTSRPPLPEWGAEWVAYQYLMALRTGNYQAAHARATAVAQARTTPGEMAQRCKEVYAAIDMWELGQPKYAFTHKSASVPVTLHYRPAWAPEEQAILRGRLSFKLEHGEWRLGVALPFITAILKQREDQHLGG